MGFPVRPQRFSSLSNWGSCFPYQGTSSSSDSQWSKVEHTPVEADISSLETQLLDYLSAEHKTNIPDWKASARDLYLVRARIDSQEVFLNPSFPNALWGETSLTNKPLPYRLPNRHASTQLCIKLRASYDDRSYSPFTLAEANWPVETVLGKDIRLGFKVLGTPEILLNTPVKEFESFVSTIELIDPKGPLPDSFHLSGDVITTRGKLIPKESAWNLLDQELGLKKGDVSKAHSVSMEPPKMADFPTLLLDVEVNDEEGNALMDLTEEDFNILVNGEKVTHRMVVNRKLPPRVLFLYDDSGSMPQDYVSREKTIEIFRQITKACHQINPETEFAVSPFGDAKTKIFKLSDWSNNVAGLSTYIQRTRSGNSHNWSALLGATNIKEANMAILVTDADGTQMASEYAEQRFKEGMPGLIYGVLDSYSNEEEFGKMAQKTNGVYFRIEEQMEEAIVDIQARISETKNERYLIEVDVENEELPFMDLELQVGNDGPLAKLGGIEAPPAAYERPAGKNAITGLYVELSYLNRTYTYRIAGVPKGASPNQYPVTQELIDECNNALWGEYILHVEASTPRASLVLDEKCQHYLNLKPLVALLDETDPDRFFKTLQSLSWRPDYPGKWPALLGSPNAYVENALNCWMYSEYPDSRGQYWQSLTPLSSSEKFAPHLGEKAALQVQLNEGLRKAYITAKNFHSHGNGFPTILPLQSYRVSPNGLSSQYFFRSHPHAEKLLHAITRNAVDQGRSFLTQDSMKASWGLLLENRSYNFIPIGTLGSLGSRKIPHQLDREKSLIDQYHLWTKTLGMKMDTWMDLEGDKLAFIQVGTVGIKGLGKQIDSQKLMEQIKEELKAYILSEQDQTAEFFDTVPEAWLNAYNISRNNLSTLFIPQNP